jgi:SAM-dependent methyltransferase
MQQDSGYQRAWQGYWAALTEVPDRPFWDAAPQQAGAVDLTRFQHFMDPTLPLIDFGCGNGTQSRFLAQHVRRVLGVDIAPAAIALATALGQPANVEYRVLDALRLADAQALHVELGDANIYMRGVLHQLSVEDQQICADTLTLLLGSSGTLYLAEVAVEARAYMAWMIEQHGERPPAMRKTQEHGITSVGIDRGRVVAMFGADRFDVLSEGDTVIHTIHRLPSGEKAQIPAHYMVLRPKKENDFSSLKAL